MRRRRPHTSRYVDAVFPSTGTVCAGCHTRLHRLRVLRVWIPELLVLLWIEQHPGVPVQLQLPVAV
jgi:hypothetical protein